MARIVYGTTQTFNCQKCGSPIHSDFRLIGDGRQQWGSPLIYCKTCGNPALLPIVKEPALAKRTDVETQLAKRPVLISVFAWFFVFGGLIFLISMVGESIGVKDVSLLFTIILAVLALCIVIWMILKKKKAIAKANQLIEESMERLKNLEYAKLMISAQGLSPESTYAEHIEKNAFTPPTAMPKDIL